MVTYNLTIQDRLNTISILPQDKTSYDKLVISEDITNKLRLTQDEIQKYKYFTETKIIGDQMITSANWDHTYDEETSTKEFHELEDNMLKEKLKELNDKNLMSKQMMNLYKIFVLGKDIHAKKVEAKVEEITEVTEGEKEVTEALDA